MVVSQRNQYCCSLYVRQTYDKLYSQTGSQNQHLANGKSYTVEVVNVMIHIALKPRVVKAFIVKRIPRQP